MIVNSEIFVTPDCPTVRIRAPRETVDLDAELPKILHHQGWDVGTIFHVQFVDRERTRLLAMAPFVVVEATETLQTTEPSPYQTMTKMVTSRKYDRLGPWFEPGGKIEPATKAPAPAPERYAEDSDWRAEHAGFGSWRVRDGEGNEVASGLDKETAQSIARGDTPVPEAA